MNSEKHTLLFVKESGSKRQNQFRRRSCRHHHYVMLGGLYCSFYRSGLPRFRWPCTSMEPYSQSNVRLAKSNFCQLTNNSSAVMVLVGKRYVFSKLSGEGIHSQRIVSYSNPSIRSLLGGIIYFRFEVLLFGLLVFWGLGFATGVTANYVVKLVPIRSEVTYMIPFGSLDAIQFIIFFFDLVFQA
jgi:hypothetical protein